MNKKSSQLYQCRCFCSLKQELFSRPLSSLATHRCGCACQAPARSWENWKAAGPSCAVSKAASEPGSILPSANSCKYSRRWIVQAAFVYSVLRNLCSPQGSPKLSAKPGWISPAAMPIILGQGQWFQVEAMPEPPVRMVLTQNKAECHTARKASAGISAPFDTDDCGPGEMLSPSHSTQEKVSTSLASHNGKIPLYFNMPWAPPIKAAAFHSNPLNVTDMWPWPCAFHLQWCSWKGLVTEVDVEVSILQPLHRHHGQPCWEPEDKSSRLVTGLFCPVVLHTGPASSLELSCSYQQAGWRPFFVGYSFFPL